MPTCGALSGLCRREHSSHTLSAGMGACLSAAADPQATKQQDQQAADPQVSARGALVPNPHATTAFGTPQQPLPRTPERWWAVWPPSPLAAAAGLAGHRFGLVKQAKPTCRLQPPFSLCRMRCGRRSGFLGATAAWRLSMRRSPPAQQRIFINAATPSGLTACHIVAHHNPDAEGASVNGVYAVNQATALHYAATNPNADAAVAAILALVAAHADVHAKTWSGAQPLVSL